MGEPVAGVVTLVAEVVAVSTAPVPIKVMKGVGLLRVVVVVSV